MFFIRLKLCRGQNNLVEDGLGLCSTLAGTIIADPLLGSPSSNGGSTQTMALLPGSAAIDGGDNAFCTSTDQRGVTRPQGSTCDIGAFEYVVPPMPTSTYTPTYTPTPTLAPSATPSYSYNPLYLSLTSNQTIGGVSSADEDILRFDGSTWSLFFDGSDVGVASLDLFAFSIVDADTILMSFNNAITLGGLAVAPQDVVQFDATLLGSATTGIFSMYLDGSDVGLDIAAEKIDSVSLLTDGRVLISTTGNPSIAGLTGLADEDILAFTPVTLGDSTTGTWALYFDGSDVGLSTTSSEDIDALDVTSNGNIYLSTLGDFAVTGVSGFDEDVFVCVPTSLGSITACNYAPALYFDGSTWGLTANDVDAFNFLSLGPVSTSTPTIIPSSTPTNTPTRTPSPTPTRTPTIFITYTPSPIFTMTSTATRTNTPTKTSTPTLTPTLPRGVFDVRILSHEPSPSNLGEAVTFTVSVTDFGGGPAGSVTVNIVSDEGSTSCTTSETSSTCSSQLTFNNPSGHLIIASVDGDSAQVDHYVNPPSTNTPTQTPTTTATLIPTITSTPGRQM